MAPIAPFFLGVSGIFPTPLNLLGIGGPTHPNQAQVRPILRRLDVSILAMVTALFLTVVSAEAITAFEGDNGPTTLKTIYGDEVTSRVRVRGRGVGLGGGGGVGPSPSSNPLALTLALALSSGDQIYQPAARRRRVRPARAGEGAAQGGREWRRSAVRQPINYYLTLALTLTLTQNLLQPGDLAARPYGPSPKPSPDASPDLACSPATQPCF